jgi:hypothetical protein
VQGCALAGWEEANKARDRSHGRSKQSKGEFERGRQTEKATNRESDKQRKLARER